MPRAVTSSSMKELILHLKLKWLLVRLELIQNFAVRTL